VSKIFFSVHWHWSFCCDCHWLLLCTNVLHEIFTRLILPDLKSALLVIALLSNSFTQISPIWSP